MRDAWLYLAWAAIIAFAVWPYNRTRTRCATCPRPLDAARRLSHTKCYACEWDDAP